MRVCFISVEIFAWGKYGGFGRATRLIGRELVKRGVEVYAVVPQRSDQKPVEILDGIKVLGFPIRKILSATDLFHQADADIYHSEEPSMGTYLARRAMPDRKHLITFRDTHSAQDWLTELFLPSLNKLQVIANFLYEDNGLVRKAVRQADGHFAAARMLIPKARNKYGLREDPKFLPTPVEIPLSVTKDPNPTVCFVSRWDRRKRPELFFDLVSKFPKVRFLAAGQSRDPVYDQALRDKYTHLPNLEMIGFIDQFAGDRLSNLLGQSWILINTAAREGLPNAFIEAAAHRCAILSAVNPNEFASQFGYHAAQDDFQNGLEILLHNNLWQERAGLGYEYVKNTFESQPRNRFAPGRL